MKQVIIDNGIAWKRVDTIDEAYAMWRMGYEPHSLDDVYMNRKFECIETGDDMDGVIERDGKSVYFNMGGVRTEECMIEMKRAGYMEDVDVNHISFVKNRHECTDRQAYASLFYALVSDEVIAEVTKALDKMATRGFDRVTGWPNK